jgi:hypothetical protein
MTPAADAKAAFRMLERAGFSCEMKFSRIRGRSVYIRLDDGRELRFADHLANPLRSMGEFAYDSFVDDPNKLYAIIMEKNENSLAH